jgi:hypothetical protein
VLRGEEGALAKRSAAAKKAAQPRKRRASGKKAATTQRLSAASKKTAKTKKRRIAPPKPAATRKLEKEQSASVPPPLEKSQVETPAVTQPETDIQEMT